MAEPMPDPGPEADPTDPWPFLTDEDHAWLDSLLDWADECATTEYEGDAEPADVLAQLVYGAEFHRAPPEQAHRWTVTDDGSAEWAMAHVARAEAELAKLDAQAREWAAEAEDRLLRIRQWFNHRAKRHLATKSFMEAHLQRYALDQRAADPKAKTLVLPSGAVKTTEQKPNAAVADEAAVIAWAVQTLDGPEREDVAPAQPRKLYVQRLRDHTSVVEVIDHAQLLLASAELVHWVSHPGAPLLTADGQLDRNGNAVPMAAIVGAQHQRCPQAGDGWPTPEEATDLVARVEVLASHLEVQGPDGLPVPGTHVEPGGVTAKVVPA